MISAGLLAALAGCGAPSASSAHGGISGNEVRATVGSQLPTPDPSASNGTVTVTVADNGETVRLRVGQRLHVVLSGRGEQQWHRPASSGPAVHLVTTTGGYPTRQPADAVFLAVQAGRASVSSVTDYACLHTQPACTIAQRVWAIRVIVTNSSARA
jgi:hypothetical protein